MSTAGKQHLDFSGEASVAPETIPEIPSPSAVCCIPACPFAVVSELL